MLFDLKPKEELEEFYDFKDELNQLHVNAIRMMGLHHY